MPHAQFPMPGKELLVEVVVGLNTVQVQVMQAAGQPIPPFIRLLSSDAAYTGHHAILVNVQTSTGGVQNVHACVSGNSLREDSERLSNLLFMLSHGGRRQFRVRGAIRARLTLGLKAPSKLPTSSRRESPSSITPAAPIFMVSGCRGRHGD